MDGSSFNGPLFPHPHPHPHPGGHGRGHVNPGPGRLNHNNWDNTQRSRGGGVLNNAPSGPSAPPPEKVYFERENSGKGLLPTPTTTNGHGHHDHVYVGPSQPATTGDVRQSLFYLPNSQSHVNTQRMNGSTPFFTPPKPLMRPDSPPFDHSSRGNYTGRPFMAKQQQHQPRRQNTNGRSGGGSGGGYSQAQGEGLSNGGPSLNSSHQSHPPYPNSIASTNPNIPPSYPKKRNESHNSSFNKNTLPVTSLPNPPHYPSPSYPHPHTPNLDLSFHNHNQPNSKKEKGFHSPRPESNTTQFDRGYESDFQKYLSGSPSPRASVREGECSGEEEMVLSKNLVVGSSVAPASTLNVLSFLDEFKVLECSCCGQVMGFQERKTGALFCTPCHVEKDNTTSKDSPAGVAAINADPEETEDKTLDRSLSKRDSQVSSIKNKNPFFSQLKKIEGPAGVVISATANSEESEKKTLDRPQAKGDGPGPLSSIKNPFFAPMKKIQEPGVAAPKIMDRNKELEDSYKHVSSLHKYKEHDSTVASFDVADNKASHVKPGPKPSPPPPAEKNENDIVNAANIRKHVNPFFKNITSVKIEEQGKTGKEIDGNLKAEEKSLARAGSKKVETEAKLETRKTRTSTPLPARCPFLRPVPVAEPAPEREPARPPVAEPAPERKPTRPPPEPKRFMWQECKYSKNLTDGADVRTCFMWNIFTLQITADADQDAVMAYQAKVASFVKSGKPMSRPPVKDEMVLGEYMEEFYRGRVVQVFGDKCTVLFVDFGDQCPNLEYTTLYEVDEELMKDPIYSVCVRLEGVKPYTKKLKVGKNLNDVLYGSLTLQMKDKFVVDDSDAFSAILWSSEDKQLNQFVAEVIAALEAKTGQ